MILSDEDVSTHEVRDWKGLHLLHFQSSSCSQKVRVLLREKGLAWTSHPVDLAAHKHVSPWYLGINPRGVVPVLVHDGVVHVESNDILQYLDELPSDAAPFFPQTDAEHAAVRANLDLENSLHMDLRNLTMGFIMPHRFAKKSAATLDRWEREGRSNPKRAIEVAWWRDYARDGIPALVARASVDAHRAVFESLEQKLAESEWLLGDRISVLEIAWFITTTRLSSAGYPISDHPRLTKWHQRLASRPAFAEETRDPFLLRAVLPLYQLFRRITKTQLTDITRRA
jgi:glutathione S-transferase